jgi:hypothetical protein
MSHPFTRSDRFARAAFIVVWAFACAAGCTNSVREVPTARQPESILRPTVEYLADDARDGRGVGTPGLDASAQFIADRFARIGVRPLPGFGGYFQPFEMTAGIAPAPTTSLRTEDDAFGVETDFLPLGLSAQREFHGGVVFAGYGVVDPSKGYDDYAGVDVNGKVVLVLRYEPVNDAGDSALTGGAWSPRATFGAKAKLAATNGAVALLTVTGPLNAGDKNLQPLVPAGEAPIPVLQVTQEAAEKLLRRGGLDDLKTLQSAINSQLKPHSRPLADVTLAGAVAFRKITAAVKNVVGYLPGQTDEYVLVGAHYDHLGRGTVGHAFGSRGQVHNGADDNASGTAVVLELARQLSHARRPPRGILFALFTAEEEGLIGSDYFVKHSPVPLTKVVAMLNLDMVGRVKNDKLLVGGSGTAESFKPMLERADETSPLALSYIGRGGLGPSDHQSFGSRKIPVLFFFSGLHPDYHRPTDDADKINYPALADVVDLSRDVVRHMASAPRPSYVGRFDAEPALFDRRSTTSTTPTTDPARRASLGVVPDYGTDESQSGVRIVGVTAGSAAEVAGLKDGDVITHAGDMRIANLYDLTEFLNRSTPGDKVKISVTRGGTRIDLDATLKARQSD